MLGFNPERFEIKRYLSPKKLKVNRKTLDQFPILKITDRCHEDWVREFKMDYEREMEILDDKGIGGLPIFEELEELNDIPF